MLAAAQLQSLKRTNISQDADKTMQRSKDLWKGLKLVQRNAIKELAGISSQTVYKVYNTGGISIKLAIAFAQTLGINPQYLTGESDEPGECTDAIIRKLLLKHGYQKLVAEIDSLDAKPAKRKYTRREKPEPEALPAETPEEKEPALLLKPAAQLPPGSDAMTSEELQQLVYALHIQAKAGITNSKEKLNQIKLIIFS